MTSGELFTDSAPRKYVEIGTGLLIDGKSVPSGVRVRLAQDVADHIVAERWGQRADGPHKGFERGTEGRGVVIKWPTPKAPPRANRPLSEWPTCMRPDWALPEYRVKRMDSPHMFPVVCSRCARPGYAVFDAETKRGAQRGDAWYLPCGLCAQPTHMSR